LVVNRVRLGRVRLVLVNLNPINDTDKQIVSKVASAGADGIDRRELQR